MAALFVIKHNSCKTQASSSFVILSVHRLAAFSLRTICCVKTLSFPQDPRETHVTLKSAFSANLYVKEKAYLGRGKLHSRIQRLKILIK